MRQRVLSACGMLAVLVVLAGCSSGSRDLLTVVRSADGGEVELASVYPGDWDEFMVICPYDSDIEDRLGFDWSGAPEIELYDGHQTVVLVRDERVVRTVELPRRTFEFCREHWGLTPGETPLTFTRNGGGIWVAEPLTPPR